MKNFFDSSTTIGIATGRAGRLEAADMCMLDTNLAEVYYNLLRIYNKKTAEHFFKRLLPTSRPIPKEIIPDAMRFKFENKRLNFSYQDALGYVYARKNKMRFITSDKAFKGMKGVKLI